MKHQHIIATIAFYGASLSWAASPCLHYGGDPIALTGKVTFETFYGPPNYGENPKTDSQETQAILVLVKPICVKAGPGIDEEREKGQQKITLVPSPGFNPPRYLGKIITVEGTLFHAYTAHHRTPVLMRTIGVKNGKEQEPQVTAKKPNKIKNTLPNQAS